MKKNRQSQASQPQSSNGKPCRKPRQRRKKAEEAKPKKYIMFGFRKKDDSCTAYLKIRDDGKRGKHGIYKITADKEEATRFNSQNVDNIDGFAPPKTWAKFFNEEAELSGWSFHPIAVNE